MKKTLIIIIAVVGVVLLGSGAWYLSYKFAEYENGGNKTSEPKIVHDMQKAEDKILKYHFDDETLFSKNMYTSELSANKLLLLAIYNVDENKINACDFGSDKKKVSPAEINDFLKELVLDKIITKENLEENAKKSFYTDDCLGRMYEYNDDGTISILTGCGCEGPSDYKKQYVTVKKEEDNDTVKIYRKVAFGKFNADKSTMSEFLYDYYLTTEHTGDIILSSTKEELSASELDKFNTYVYTLKLIDDNYYLISVTLEK